jgi:hypothetical protein
LTWLLLAELGLVSRRPSLFSISMVQNPSPSSLKILGLEKLEVGRCWQRFCGRGEQHHVWLGMNE